MDDSDELLRLAVLLERAYRLALDVHDVLVPTESGSQRASLDLLDVLDHARVSLLKVSQPAPCSSPSPRGCAGSRQLRRP